MMKKITSVLFLVVLCLQGRGAQWENVMFNPTNGALVVPTKLNVSQLAGNASGITNVQGASITPSAANMIGVDINGDDSNPGTLLAPVLSISNGLSKANSSSVVVLGAGTFTPANDMYNEVVVPQGATLSGNGRSNTVISLGGVLGVDLADNTTVRDLCVFQNTQGHWPFTVVGNTYTPTGPGEDRSLTATNCLIQNCRINGIFRHAVLIDCTNVSSGRFLDCDIECGIGDSVCFGSPTQSIPIAGMTNSNWSLENCYVYLRTGSAAIPNQMVVNAIGTMSVHGGKYYLPPGKANTNDCVFLISGNSTSNYIDPDMVINQSSGVDLKVAGGMNNITVNSQIRTITVTGSSNVFNGLLGQAITDRGIGNVYNYLSSPGFSPTIRAEVGAGTGATASLDASAKDARMLVTIVGGSNPKISPQPICTITYNQPHPTVPYVFMSPANYGAANPSTARFDVEAVNCTTTNFQIWIESGLMINQTTYQWWISTTP